jgi:large subunit ribosomal protein L18
MTKHNIKPIERTKSRIRDKVKGTSLKPRLSIFRSNQHIYAQIIDDSLGKTIVSSSTLDKDVKSTIESSSTCDASIIVGLYHGRIKALANAAREEGLNF